MISPRVILTALAAFANTVAAAGVTGAAEGFAKGVTGGGSAAPVYPTTNAELVSYLTDSSARTIILTKTFDFTGTEGTQTTSGCAPYGTASACQLAINKDDVSGRTLLGCCDFPGFNRSLMLVSTSVVQELPGQLPDHQLPDL